MEKAADRADGIYLGDSLGLIKGIDSESVHLILSDIPYGIGAGAWDVLHANSNAAYLGSSPAQEKAGAVFRKRGKPLNGWSEADRLISKQYYDWVSTWAGEWFRVLKPGASAFVFAGRRLAHRCVCAFEDAGFTYKDMIAWEKGRAAHRAQRIGVVFDRRGDSASARTWEGWKVGNLRPSFEPILWLAKPYRIGGTLADNILEHGVGAYNEAALKKYGHEPDNILRVQAEKTDKGSHPTQKPLLLMKLLIELATVEGQVVLDPFCGSGTTLVAASRLGRRFIGFEREEAFFAAARDRIDEEKAAQRNASE